MIFRCCVHTSRFIVNSLNVDFCVACLLTNELTIYFLWTVSLCWGRSVLTEGSFSVGRITSDHLTNNSMCDWLLLIFQDNRSDSRGVPGWEAVDCLVENLVNLNRTITALSTAEIAERVWLYSRINYMDNFPSSLQCCSWEWREAWLDINYRSLQQWFMLGYRESKDFLQTTTMLQFELQCKKN